MQSMQSDFIFPQYLMYAWVSCLIMLVFGHLYYYRKNLSHKFTIEAKLAQSFLSRSTMFFWARSSCIALSWVFAVLALSFPIDRINRKELSASNAKELEEQTSILPPHEIVFLIDSSRSMQALDGGKRKSRFTQSKSIATEILGHLEGYIVSLYAFTDQVDCIVPSTYDYVLMNLRLEGLELNELGDGGTNIAHLISEMKKRYVDEGFGQRTTFVLLSDGEEKFSHMDQENAQQRIEVIQQLLALFPKNLTNWFVVGTGSKHGARVPEIEVSGHSVVSIPNIELLQTIAEQGRGRLYLADQLMTSEIGDDFAFCMDSASLSNTQDQIKELYLGVTDPDVVDLWPIYHWPLCVALLLLLVALWLPQQVLTEPKEQKL